MKRSIRRLHQRGPLDNVALSGMTAMQELFLVAAPTSTDLSPLEGLSSLTRLWTPDGASTTKAATPVTPRHRHLVPLTPHLALAPYPP